MKHDKSFTAYTHPAGGWGSVHSLGRSLTHERVPLRGSRILMHQNKPDGFACVPMFQLGGNLVRSLPDYDRLLPAWRKLDLTVQIETKLNRSCLVHGEASYILPCLGRIEIDRQDGVPQDVSMEDSTACIHGSHGYAEPASPELRSEPWIIAALAKATLPPNRKIDWDGWVADYGRIRDAIERTYPEMFKDSNKPGGFHRPMPACKPEWKTKNGKANFIVPDNLTADIDVNEARSDIFQLTTHGRT